MQPSFLIGGIMKSGTTFLFNLIKQHPEIQMPKRSMKFSFFDNDLVYKKGFSWYQTIFKGLDDHLTIGQVSADCAFNPGSIERIKKHLPNVKLIFIMRNPIDRAYSLYWHQIKMGREYNSFERAVELEDEKIKKNYYNFKMYSYLERSRYAKQVRNIKSHFNDDQLLFIPFEVFIKNELEILNVVFEFLGVHKINDIAELKISNIPKNKAKIPKYMFILKLTAFLNKLKFERLARFLLTRTLIYKNPPKMSLNTKKKLEEVLSDDINFHQSLVKEFSNSNPI